MEGRTNNEHYYRLPASGSGRKIWQRSPMPNALKYVKSMNRGRLGFRINKKQTISFRNYKQLLLSTEHKEFFVQEIYEKCWPDIEKGTNLDAMLDELISNLNESVDKYTSMKTFEVKEIHSSNVRFDSDVRKAQNILNYWFREARRNQNISDWEIYKGKRNKATAIIRKKKRSYYAEQISEFKNQPKEMWRI